MWKLMAAAAVALTIHAGTAAGGDRPVVIELYTSQGCSSCPPADGLLRELAARDDVIALALHVDYWDYLGWRDKFASAAFTKRQKGYARAANGRMVYTPQFIVEGADHVAGFRPVEIADLIRAYRARPDRMRLLASRRGGRVEIRGELIGRSRSAGLMVVQLAHYAPQETVDIEHGENAGKRVVYSNIVTSWKTVAEWDGHAPLSVNVDATQGPAAVIVQEAGFGPVLAAARLR